MDLQTETEIAMETGIEMEIGEVGNTTATGMEATADPHHRQACCPVDRLRPKGLKSVASSVQSALFRLRNLLVEPKS